MCGIAGLVAPWSDGTEVVKEMTERIRHRGPDGGGVTSRAGVHLGMARLAIVDIAGGQQPMLSDDASVALVFNGEIYNAPELRRAMEREGIRFHTRSDTEVILRLFERDSKTVESHLAGMWAVAVHDRARNTLTLSRDRFGIKPLFVLRAGNHLAFASELGCLEVLRAREPFAQAFEVDVSAAHAMLAWAYVPGQATIYSGIRRLEPASRLEIDLATGGARERRYWHATPSVDAARVTTMSEAEDLVSSAMRRSVAEHLESDVPIATFLSGGIDSSLVTAWARDRAKEPITAFSIGFEEARFDESMFARETARRLGVAHRVETLSERTVGNTVLDALLAYDEPFGDSSSIATLLLARVVARTHKVALAGDGGDEVFAGYRKHKILPWRSLLGRVPALRALVHEAAQRLPAPLDRTSAWTDALRSVRRFALGLGPSDASAWVSLSQVVPVVRAQRLVARATRAAAFEAEAIRTFEATSGTTLQRFLVSDLGSPLTNDMLTKVDRATMAVGLEARVPFLDHRVVEIGLGLPSRFTLSGGKRVLRSLHQKRFGSELAGRRKMGFGVPVESWLRGFLAPFADALFDAKRLAQFGVLSEATLGAGRWRECLQTDAYLVWHALALAVWCETHLGDGRERVTELFDAARSRALGSP